MPDSSETQVKTAIIDTWMSVENVKKLWITEKFEINIYIYIYINIYVYFNFPTYLYPDSITYIIP